MKTIAVLQADLEVTPLGTRSRLADRIAGVPVLRRTVQQLTRVAALDGIFVLAPESQASACRDILAGLDCTVQSVSTNPTPWARLVRASRKWSLDGWRGGVGGSTVFDEFTDCRLLSGLLDLQPADAVLSAPPAAPLLDPELADQMIEHRRKYRDHARLTFTAAVPGIAGLVLDSALIRELASAGTPVSWLFAYKPDSPRKDLIFQSACMEIPAPLRFATGRLIADTDRAVRTIETFLASINLNRAATVRKRTDLQTGFGSSDAHLQKESWTLAEIGQFLVEADERGIDDFPREVEIELTTDDPFPNALLAPRGEKLGRTGTMSLDLVRTIAAELTQRDDALCVLGGFGDPLRHPDFLAVLEILRPRTARFHSSNASHLPLSSPGVFGLGVRTTAADLTPEIAEALIAHDVDILSVSLDAWSDETFQLVKRLNLGPPLPSRERARGEGHASNAASTFQDIRDRLELLASLQQQRQSPTPIVVPDMIKSKENVHELDEFFDGWIRRTGAVSITGYSDFASQMENHSVMDMRPPQRIPCRRLRTRCLILADGRVTLCDQDFRPLHTVTRLGDPRREPRTSVRADTHVSITTDSDSSHATTLSEIWRSPEFQRIREAHLAARYDAHPLCATCSQWHRP